MKKHRTDLVALIFGLAFVITGGAFLVDELVDDAIDPAWTFSIAFVLIGVVALVTTLFRGARELTEPEPAPEPEPPAATASTANSDPEATS